jgi:hypothetical protein
MAAVMMEAIRKKAREMLPMIYFPEPGNYSEAARPTMWSTGEMPHLRHSTVFSGFKNNKSAVLPFQIIVNFVTQKIKNTLRFNH